MGFAVNTLVLSPFTNPLAVQVNVGLSVSKFLVRLFAVIVSVAGVTVSLPGR